MQYVTYLAFGIEDSPKRRGTGKRLVAQPDIADRSTGIQCYRPLATKRCDLSGIYQNIAQPFAPEHLRNPICHVSLGNAVQRQRRPGCKANTAGVQTDPIPSYTLQCL